MNLPSSFLHCISVFDQKEIKAMKKQIKHFNTDRKIDPYYHKFLDWTPGETELMVLTTYASEPIPIPAIFDVMFEIKNPMNFTFEQTSVTQAILNGYAPINRIEKGHKHVCVIEFDRRIPEIFTGNQRSNIIGKQLLYEIGLCSYSEFLKFQARIRSK